MGLGIVQGLAVGALAANRHDVCVRERMAVGPLTGRRSATTRRLCSRVCRVGQSARREPSPSFLPTHTVALGGMLLLLEAPQVHLITINVSKTVSVPGALAVFSPMCPACRSSS